MATIPPLLRDLTPPIVLRAVRKLLPRGAAEAPAAPAAPALEPAAETAAETATPPPIATRPDYGFFGDYRDFDEAAADASEYDSAKIAQSAAAQIPTFFQDAYCEIDGRYQQVHSALASVMERLGKNRLAVLDIGGGNGNNFIACSKLSPSAPYDWTIVETESMCAACDGRLPVTWTSTIPDGAFDVVLISGTLQYLPDPYAALQDLGRRAPWLIVHRTPILDSATDRLTIQIVDPNIYPGELLRHWFLAGENLRRSLGSVGEIVLSWRNLQDDPAYAHLGAKAYGYLVRSRLT